MYQTPAIIARIQTMSDGGIRIVLDTPELSPVSVAEIFEYKGKEVYVAFSHRRFDHPSTDV